MAKTFKSFLKLAINADSTLVAQVIGIATFIFGFGAGALYNLYLIYTKSPVVSELRTTLTFKSAVFGDGLVLPVVNAVAVLFILKNKNFISKNTLNMAFFGGGLVTAYFHLRQALGGLVNWAMPTPWHWNLLGLYHGVYMYSVATFLCFFYILAFKVIAKEKRIPWQVITVTLGMVIFFTLLEYDYR